MAWMVLIVAALNDLAMAVALEDTDRWTRFWPSLPGLLFANAGVYLFTHSLKGLAVGTAFALFTGIGAMGISIIEVCHFQESGPPARLLSMALILTAIVALKLLKT